MVGVVCVGSVRFVRGASDDFVGNDAGCGFRSPSLGSSYRPEWKIRGSLCRSSANSKKALSGLTAFRRFDHSGIA